MTLKEVKPSTNNDTQKFLPYNFQIMTNVLIPPTVQSMRNVSTPEAPTPACVTMVSMEMEKTVKVRLNINSIKLSNILQ